MKSLNLIFGWALREVEDGIWLVSFLDYDLGFFDKYEDRVEPTENPFAKEKV